MDEALPLRTMAHVGINHGFEYRLQNSHQTALKYCFSRCSEGEQQLSWREAGPAAVALRHKFSS